MENPTTKKSYDEIRKAAREFYNSIGRVWCPVLDDEIIFNSIGFSHLLQKGRRPRSMHDQLRRFRLLNFTPDILSDPRAEVSYEEKAVAPQQKGERTEMLPSAKFWKISRRQGKSRITVVVRQVEAKKKHFFSIYN